MRGLLALRSGSDLWFSVFYTLTTFILLVAILAARLRRGYERAFWFGFAVFGCGYYLLGLGMLNYPLREDFHRNLIPTRLLK